MTATRELVTDEEAAELAQALEVVSCSSLGPRCSDKCYADDDTGCATYANARMKLNEALPRLLVDRECIGPLEREFEHAERAAKEALARAEKAEAQLADVRAHMAACKAEHMTPGEFVNAVRDDLTRAEIKLAVVEKRAKDSLDSLLKRPEMWAFSPEAYEAQFLLFLAMLGVERPQDHLQRWWVADHPNRQANIPIWSRVQSLQEMVAILRQFYADNASVWGL